MRRILMICVTLLLSVTLHLRTFASESIEISTIEELVEYAAKDGVDVTMRSGVYKIDDPKVAKRVVIKKYSATSAKEDQVGVDYPITTLLHFSGSNSTYNLQGVTIKLSGELHESFSTGHIFELFVTGDNNTIKGLSMEDEGDVPPKKGSAIMVHIMGDDNTLDGVQLLVRGSSPYGYGHLLGKGGSSVLVDLHKHSSLLVSGRDTKLLRCRVITRAYGHGIVMQGAVNTYIEGCYVEGRMRTTDDMLAERSGVAYDSGFKTIYPPGVIEPNRMIALSEDGVRTYPYGGYVGRRTQGLTVVNTCVKNMRSGIDASVHIPPTVIRGCTMIGCQEKGYSVGSQSVVVDCRGDAKYSPLLTFQRNDVKDCYIDLELIPTHSSYKVDRLAEINGSGHYIKIRPYASQNRETPLPIVFAESFWGDVHIYRQADADPSKFVGARNVTLINETTMPVKFSKYSEDCHVETNAEVIADEGVNNTSSRRESNIEIINKGVAGNTSSNLLSRVDTDVVALRPDLVIVMVGTNDMLNSRKVIPIEKYRENMKLLIEQIKAGGADVMLLSSIPADKEYLYQRHDTTKFAAEPRVVMAQVSEAVGELARQYNCHFVDLFGEFSSRGIPQHNQDPYIRNEQNSRVKDGVHPTAAGYELMADIVARYFEDNNLQTKYRRVVCFGDSITKGSGAKAGKDYPTQLTQKLNDL